MVMRQRSPRGMHPDRMTRPRWLRPRLSIPDRKGRGLALASAFWAAIGFSILQSGERIVPGAWHQSPPAWVRVTWWLIPAAVALAAAFRPGRRCRDIAVGLLCVGPGIRATSYLGSWVFTFLPAHPDGIPSGRILALSVVAAAAAVWVTRRARYRAAVWVTLAVAAALSALTHLAAAVWDDQVRPEGYARGWSAACIYGLMVWFVLYIADDPGEPCADDAMRAVVDILSDSGENTRGADSE